MKFLPADPFSLVGIVEEAETASSFNAFKIVVGTSAVCLDSAGASGAPVGLTAPFGWTIRLDKASSGTVLIGNSATVGANTGFLLNPGEFVTVNVSKLASIFALGSAIGQNVYCIG
jgi:hypothetical protein